MGCDYRSISIVDLAPEGFRDDYRYLSEAARAIRLGSRVSFFLLL